MILMRSPDKKDQLSEVLKLSATDLKKLGIVDSIVPEPFGGAHNDTKAIAASLKAELIDSLAGLAALSTDDLVRARIKKFRDMGRWSDR